MANKYSVDGSSNQRVADGVNNNPKYAVWRVVLADDPSHLICAFFGGASYHAAHSFCDMINADPKWNED